MFCLEWNNNAHWDYEEVSSAESQNNPFKWNYLIHKHSFLLSFSLSIINYIDP